MANNLGSVNNEGITPVTAPVVPATPTMPTLRQVAPVAGGFAVGLAGGIALHKWLIKPVFEAWKARRAAKKAKPVNDAPKEAPEVKA